MQNTESVTKDSRLRKQHLFPQIILNFVSYLKTVSEITKEFQDHPTKTADNDMFLKKKNSILFLLRFFNIHLIKLVLRT